MTDAETTRCVLPELPAFGEVLRVLVGESLAPDIVQQIDPLSLILHPDGPCFKLGYRLKGSASYGPGTKLPLVHSTADEAWEALGTEGLLPPDWTDTRRRRFCPHYAKPGSTAANSRERTDDCEALLHLAHRPIGLVPMVRWVSAGAERLALVEELARTFYAGLAATWHAKALPPFQTIHWHGLRWGERSGREILLSQGELKLLMEPAMIARGIPEGVYNTMCAEMLTRRGQPGLLRGLPDMMGTGQCSLSAGYGMRAFTRFSGHQGVYEPLVTLWEMGFGVLSFSTGVVNLGFVGAP